MHHSGLSIQISRYAQAPDRCLESSLRGYPSDAIAVLSLSVSVLLHVRLAAGAYIHDPTYGFSPSVAMNFRSSAALPGAMYTSTNSLALSDLGIRITQSLLSAGMVTT